ncbi:MAG: hypothetical protein ABEN55_17510 [Bradymonadaceae bacterium]
MISPEILKQSATAGFAGLAVASTIVAVAVSNDGSSEADIDISQWTDPVRVSFETADEVTERAEQTAAMAADRQREAQPARRAGIRARNRAARRAVRELEGIDCRTIDDAKVEAQKVRIHINRAERSVIEQP